jgi:hypothetical protein
LGQNRVLPRYSVADRFTFSSGPCARHALAVQTADDSPMRYAVTLAAALAPTPSKGRRSSNLEIVVADNLSPSLILRSAPALTR